MKMRKGRTRRKSFHIQMRIGAMKFHLIVLDFFLRYTQHILFAAQVCDINDERASEQERKRENKKKEEEEKDFPHTHI